LEIHDAKEVANFGQESILVYPNSRWTVRVTPVKVDAEEDIGSLPFSERRCRMSDEVYNAHIHKSYTQQNCLTEYKMVEATKEAECVPWFMPMTGKNLSFHICQPDQATTFLNALEDESLLAKVDDKVRCQEPCQSITYDEHTMYRSNMKAATECEKLRKYYNSSYPVTLPHVSFLMTAEGSGNFDAMDLRMAMLGYPCNVLMKGTIILTIKPGRLRVNVITQRKRVSFSSQLANFGKWESKANVGKVDNWFQVAWSASLQASAS